jgi:glycosyltransferase involved in cell wall biosynthesis
MNELSVVHLAQSDSEGGANKAAYRIHKNLQSIGIRSSFHVGRKHLNDESVVPAHLPGAGLRVSGVVAYLNARKLKSYPHKLPTPFSPVGLRYGQLDAQLIAEADVVCAHWIAGAFLNFSQLETIRKPIIWRLSDIWPFSGGCHYPGECDRFEQECGACPQLGSHSENDLSRAGIEARARTFAGLNLTIAAPSRWIADLARSSRLFGERRIEHIPTGVDLNVFRPRDRLEARRRFGLPKDGQIVLFGALGATEDPRKGYSHFTQCIEMMVSTGMRDVVPVIFGGVTEGISSIAGLPAFHLGRVETEDDMSLVYSAADVLVAPFLEDNLPNVILEAIACGTAVAAFAAGGIRDAIEDGVSGILAPIGDDETLANGVVQLLYQTMHPRFRHAVREFAERRFDLAQCIRRYAGLFEDVVHSAR